MHRTNMKDRRPGMQRVILALACAVASACTHQPTQSQPVTSPAPVAAPPSVAPVAPVAPTACSEQAPPAAAPVPAAAPAPAQAPPPAQTPSPAQTSPPAQTPPPAPAPKAAPTRTAPKPPAAPSAAAAATGASATTAPAAPPLDLPLLEQRLKDTRAIGVFTKLSLKNQVDDLLKQFRAYHQGGSGKTLPQLRQSYEILLLKVVSLLQDDDPTLAAAVGSSREAIWGVLVDPKKFANLDA